MFSYVKRTLITTLILASAMTIMSCSQKKKSESPTPPIDEPNTTLPDNPSLPSEDNPSNPSTPSEPSGDNPTNPTTPTDPSEPTNPSIPEVKPDPTDLVLPNVDVNDAVLGDANAITDAFYSFDTKTSAHFSYIPKSAEVSWQSNNDGSNVYAYSSIDGVLELDFNNQAVEGSKYYSSDGKFYYDGSGVYDTLVSNQTKKPDSTIATMTYKKENGVYSGSFSLVIKLNVRLKRNSTFAGNLGVGAELLATYEGTFTNKTVNYNYRFELKDKKTSTNDVVTILTQEKTGTFTKDTPVVTVVNSNASFDLSTTSTSTLSWTTDTSMTTLNIPDSDATIDNLEFNITFAKNKVVIVLDEHDVYGSGELKGLIKNEPKEETTE